MINLATAARSLVAALGLALLGGCYHENYTYRAVPNVNVVVSRAQNVGSEGPVLLLSLDDIPQPSADQPKRKTGADMIDALTAEQIARFDPQMAELNRAASMAYQNLQQARARQGRDDPKVKELTQASDNANKAVDDYVKDFKARNRTKVTGMPNVPSTAAPPKEENPPQTVLVGNVVKDFGERGSMVSRTFVLAIDGSPRPGTYWMTSDNSVLVTYSAWSPPSRSRVAITGSVEILKIEGDKIYTHVALRETAEGDSTEWVAHIYDPKYWQTPWTLNGKHVFTVTTKNDPVFDRAGVHWVKPAAGEPTSSAAAE